jgi:hypothetical protein
MEVTSLLFESRILVKKTRNVRKTEAVKTIFKDNVKCCNKISITKNEYSELITWTATILQRKLVKQLE